MEMRDDLLHTFRALRSQSAPLAGALLTLALAIGINAAMVGLAGRAFLTPPEHLQDPDRLVTLAFERRQGDQRVLMTTTSYVTFTSIRDHVPAFSGAAAWQRTSTTAMIEGDQSQASAMLVSGSYFEVLGAAPRMGRAILPEDDRAAAEPVAVLGHGFWRTAFGGDRNVLGRRLAVNGL
jgi:putative ABC transport system permease protein